MDSWVSRPVARGPLVFWQLAWMVMMNDDQRAGDVLAGSGSAAATGRADSSGLSAAETDPTTADTGAEALDDQDEDQAAEAGKPKSRWSFLTEMVVLFAVALTIALLIK